MVLYRFMFVDDVAAFKSSKLRDALELKPPVAVIYLAFQTYIYCSLSSGER